MLPRDIVVFIVVGTLALVSLIYALTLASCAITGLSPQAEILNGLKEVGLVTIGALSSLLARTGSSPDEKSKPDPEVKASITKLERLTQTETTDAN